MGKTVAQRKGPVPLRIAFAGTAVLPGQPPSEPERFGAVLHPKGGNTETEGTLASATKHAWAEYVTLKLWTLGVDLGAGNARCDDRAAKTTGRFARGRSARWHRGPLVDGVDEQLAQIESIGAAAAEAFYAAATGTSPPESRAIAAARSSSTQESFTDRVTVAIPRGAPSHALYLAYLDAAATAEVRAEAAARAQNTYWYALQTSDARGCFALANGQRPTLHLRHLRPGEQTRLAKTSRLERDRKRIQGAIRVSESMQGLSGPAIEIQRGSRTQPAAACFRASATGRLDVTVKKGPAVTVTTASYKSQTVRAAGSRIVYVGAPGSWVRISQQNSPWTAGARTPRTRNTMHTVRRSTCVVFACRA